MFWPVTERTLTGKTLVGRTPWVTIAWMSLLVVGFIWSRIGLFSSDNGLLEKKEAMYCFFLMHDYTSISPPYRDLFHPKIVRQAQRTELEVQAYYSDPMRQQQGQHLLSEGRVSGNNELVDNMKSRPKGTSCLGFASFQGQLSRSPRERLLVTLSRLTPTQFKAHQRELEAHIQAYLRAEQEHPLLGWGIRPAVNQPITLVTAQWIQPHFFALLWILLLIWLMGKMMEDQWRYPLWLIWPILAGFLCNGLLLLILAQSKTLILGTHGALVGLLAVWSIVYGSDTLKIDLWLPKQPEIKRYEIPAYSVVIAWFVLEMLDVLVLQRTSPLVFVVHVLAFGLLAGGIYALQQANFLEIALGEPRGVTEEERANPTWQTNAQIRLRQEQLRQEQQERADALAKQGRFDEAARLYKELLQQAKPQFSLVDNYLQLSEKAQKPATLEEYLLGIRLALFEHRHENLKAIYERLKKHHDTASLPPREHIALAADLKKAGLPLAAAEEADRIMDKGQESSFFMKALIIRADSLLDHGEDPEAAMRLYYQARNFLESYPEFSEVVSKGLQRAQDILDAPEPVEQAAPTPSKDPSIASLPTLTGTFGGLQAPSLTASNLTGASLQAISPPIPQGPPGATPPQANLPQGPPRRCPSRSHR